MKHYTLYIYAALAGLMLAACEHKELCFDHAEHAEGYNLRLSAQYEQEWEYRYEGGTDWQTVWRDLPQMSYAYDALRPAIPDGLRATAFPPAGGQPRVTNMPPMGGRVITLTAGPQDVLFYNNDTEYILFSAMNSSAQATASTRTRTRATYLGSPYVKASEEEHTVNQPDMLYAHYADALELPRQERPTDYLALMRPLVFTYYVRMEFSHGLEYVALARGALAGMASGVVMSTGQTLAEPATVLFDADLRPWGCDARVRSFGVPAFPNPNYTRTEAAYGLNVEVRLRNGQMKKFDFDVTSQVRRQPHGGVITVSGLEVTDEEGKPGSSGFLIHVDDWGEYNDVYLPM